MFSQLKKPDILISPKSEFQSPFPYEDCRTVLQNETDQYEEFVPDLNTYFYSIASHCMGIDKVLSWNGERLLASEKLLSRSFFQKYSKYEPLESRVTEATTPRLHQRLQLCEELRNSLVHIITMMLKENLVDP